MGISTLRLLLSLSSAQKTPRHKFINLKHTLHRNMLLSSHHTNNRLLHLQQLPLISQAWSDNWTMLPYRSFLALYNHNSNRLNSKATNLTPNTNHLLIPTRVSSTTRLWPRFLVMVFHNNNNNNNNNNQSNHNLKHNLHLSNKSRTSWRNSLDSGNE